MFFTQPAPDIAIGIWYTGIDHFTKKNVFVAKDLEGLKMQRSLAQFFKPSNYFEVRDALIQAKLSDLIGGCDGLIPAEPPKEALEARRQQANNAFKGDHYHTVANPAKGEAPGERGAEPVKPTRYRPGRKSAGRRDGKKRGN